MKKRSQKGWPSTKKIYEHKFIHEKLIQKRTFEQFGQLRQTVYGIVDQEKEFPKKLAIQNCNI